MWIQESRETDSLFGSIVALVWKKMYTCNRSGKAIIEIIWKDNNFMNDERYLELLAEKYPTEQGNYQPDGNIKSAERNRTFYERSSWRI